MKAFLALAMFVVLCVLCAGAREVVELDALHGPNKRWSWIRSVVIHGPPEHLDYVFVGSSKTLNAIKPLQLAEELPGTRSLNLAHFDHGHDADYYVVEHLLEHHDVDRLIVEIPYQVAEVPHSATSLLVGLGEISIEMRGALLELGPLDFLTYSSAFKERVDRLSRHLGTLAFSLPKHLLLWTKLTLEGRSHALIGVEPRWGPTRGFDWRDDTIEPKPRFVEYWQKRPHLPTPTQPGTPVPGKPEHPAPGSRQDLYLRKLAALAAAHGTQLTFLQIPSLWRPPPSLERYAYYREFGDVLVPDLGLIYEFDHYADSHHLYGEGASLFNRHLAELLREGAPASPYSRYYADIERRARAGRKDEKPNP